MCKMPSGFLKRLASYEEEKPTKTYMEQESYRNEAAWSWKNLADVMQHTTCKEKIRMSNSALSELKLWSYR